jgi:hypothetical protein
LKELEVEMRRRAAAAKNAAERLMNGVMAKTARRTLGARLALLF